MLEFLMTSDYCKAVLFRWYHSVTSGPGRNLAVNVWFMHRLWFDTNDCEEKRSGLQDAAPMDQYSVAGLDNSRKYQVMGGKCILGIQGETYRF